MQDINTDYELDALLMRHSGYEYVEFDEIKGDNGGAYLVEYNERYMWLPIKLCRHVNLEVHTAWVYSKIWRAIVQQADPNERDRWSIWV